MIVCFQREVLSFWFCVLVPGCICIVLCCKINWKLFGNIFIVNSGDERNNENEVMQCYDSYRITALERVLIPHLERKGMSYTKVLSRNKLRIIKCW